MPKARWIPSAAMDAAPYFQQHSEISVDAAKPDASEVRQYVTIPTRLDLRRSDHARPENPGNMPSEMIDYGAPHRNPSNYVLNYLKQWDKLDNPNVVEPGKRLVR